MLHIPQRLIPWCATYFGDDLIGVQHTVEIELEVCSTPRRLLCDRISRRSRNRIRLSGAQIGSNHEKTGGRKSHDTLPLRTIQMEVHEGERNITELRTKIKLSFCFWVGIVDPKFLY